MGQHDQHEHRTAPDSMDDQIRNLVATHGEIFADCLIGHFELIVELHNPDQPDGTPLRVRWSPAGASPHMSLGLLRAAACRLENQLAAS